MSDISSSLSVGSGSGTTYVSGSSGYDYSGLIEAQYQAALQPAYDLEAEVEQESLELAAYQEMQGLLLDMQSALDDLTTDGTFGDSSVFDSKAGYLSSDTSTSADSLMGASVSSDASAGIYEIEVLEIAEAHKLASGTVADSSADLGYSGSFTIQAADGTASTITVDSDTSLSELEALINAESDTTGVSASILQVGSNDYRLILTGENTNQAITITSTAGDDVMTSLGVTDGAGGFSNELQAAKAASFTVDGITLTRDSNDIDDVLEGVTFSLYAAEPGTTITLEIEDDLTAISNAISSFVDAYNAYRSFAITHQSTSDDGTASDTAVLFGDSTLRTVNRQMNDYLASMVEVDGTSYALGNFGITMDGDNYLEIDSSTLENALLTDLDAVSAFFQFESATSTDELAVLGHEGVYGNMDFTLNVAVDGSGDLTGADIDGDSSMITIVGSNIYGAEGTAYEGLHFSYVGDTSQAISVSIRQGLADQMTYLMDLFADGTTGLLAEQNADLQDSIQDKQEEISEIEAEAEDYYQDLVEKYADIESQITASNLLIDQIQALLDASSD